MSLYIRKLKEYVFHFKKSELKNVITKFDEDNNLFLNASFADLPEPLEMLDQINFKHLYLYINLSQENGKNFESAYFNKFNKNIVTLFEKSGYLAYDFEKLPNIEELEIYHHKNTRNYNKLFNLRYLRINKYDKKDLTEFKDLTNLDELILSQGNVENINSIENLSKLKILWLGYFKNLTINEKIKFNSIEELVLTSCPNVDLEILPKVFPNLKKLTVVNFKEIKTLKPIFENLKKLKEFNFAECKLLENNNEYWKNYPNVDINFSNQKDFKLKRKDFGLS